MLKRPIARAPLKRSCQPENDFQNMNNQGFSQGSDFPDVLQARLIFLFGITFSALETVGLKYGIYLPMIKKVKKRKCKCKRAFLSCKVQLTSLFDTW